MTWKVEVLQESFSAVNVKSAGYLVQAFRQWLNNNKLHKGFGRYGRLTIPKSTDDVNLSRVHIFDDEKTAEFDQKRTPTFHRKSDAYLVYAINPNNPEHYLLLVVIDPKAHDKVNQINFVITLIELAKKKFGITW
ncbi:type II toxin-antitoxin system YafO family toxin [Rheinheimera sp.]|uniref:type II toxin-antitoxin system YafO family toxin n=1 Tax=Rheinheimera sp. TaxID=1869214 RepID=UPI002733C8BB|nr:type II toxin-antitoxin system YafO family toxin [Rheinheimera sp.]MDP2715512.1 type II toxin-antitoxin system YafO family toxin [Rheinheimera sp.]